MKKQLLLGLGIALLAISCSSETEPQQENTSKITRIEIGTANIADTRTVSNADTHAVTWAVGDEIAVFHVNGSGRSDYKHFVLESGAGNASAYFKGVSDNDYLTPGETYKVIYPYSAVEKYDGINDEFEMHANISGSNNTDHLANYNWLSSASQRIGTDGTMPAFSLAQSMALAKLQVDVENFTVTGATNKRYLSNLNLTATDASKVFDEYIYLDNNLSIASNQMSEVASIGFSSNVQIADKSSYYYWIPIRQDASQGIKQLSISAHWRTLSGTDYSADVTYTPQSVFISGYIYSIHLKLRFADNSGNSGTLTLVN